MRLACSMRVETICLYHFFFFFNFYLFIFTLVLDKIRVEMYHNQLYNYMSMAAVSVYVCFSF